MRSNEQKLSLTPYDDIFSTEESRHPEQQERIQQIPLKELHPFKDHPFRVLDDDRMMETVESVKEYGVLVPIIVRPSEDGGYEIVSGHRRKRACELAGIDEIPVIIRDLDNDEAVIIMVDSNLQRENILPSEKAKAYQMKMEALKHQGKRHDLTSGQVGPKLRTDEQMAEEADDSARQIKRYIRLTHLIPELLAYMDEGKMALSVGVELSYLYEEHQRAVAEASEYYDCTPSYAQAVRLRKESSEQYCILTQDRIFKILGEEKANQREKISFQVGDLRKYFPETYTAREMQNTILRLLEQEHQRQHRSRDYER